MESFAYIYSTLLLLTICEGLGFIACLKVMRLRGLWAVLSAVLAIGAVGLGAYELVFIGVDSPFWTFAVIIPVAVCCVLAWLSASWPRHGGR